MTQFRHIHKSDFHNSFSYDEIWEFEQEYSSECWDFAASHTTKHNRISKSAVKIAHTIKCQCGLDLFPLVIHVACGAGWGVAGGSYAFMMIDKNKDDYYFDQKAKWYKSLKRKYDIYQPYGSQDTIISPIF